MLNNDHVFNSYAIGIDRRNMIFLGQNLINVLAAYDIRNGDNTVASSYK